MQNNTVSIDTFQYDTKQKPEKLIVGLKTSTNIDLRNDEYHLVLNPNTSNGDMILTYSDFEEETEKMFAELKVNNGRFMRIDFAYDSYIPGIYTVMYKTNLVFMALVANKHNMENAYTCKQLFRNDDNSINIKGQYFDIECYDKKLDEPECKVTCRLEFRAKRIPKYLGDETLPTRYVVEKTWSRVVKEYITECMTIENYDEVITRFTDLILEEFTQFNGKKKDIDIVLYKNIEKIINLKQLETIYTAVGYADAKQKAQRFAKRYDLERVSFKQLKTYADDIIKCGKMYLAN